MSAIPYRAEIFFWPAGSPQTRRPRGPQLILPRRRAPHRYPQTTKTPAATSESVSAEDKADEPGRTSEATEAGKSAETVEPGQAGGASPARSMSPAPNGVTNTQSPAPATNTPGNESTAVGGSAADGPPGQGESTSATASRPAPAGPPADPNGASTGAPASPSGVAAETDRPSGGDSASGTDSASRTDSVVPGHPPPRSPPGPPPKALGDRPPPPPASRPGPRCWAPRSACGSVGDSAARRARAVPAAIPAPQPGAAAVSGGRWWRLCWPWSSWRWPGCSCPVP